MMMVAIVTTMIRMMMMMMFGRKHFAACPWCPCHDVDDVDHDNGDDHNSDDNHEEEHFLTFFLEMIRSWLPIVSSRWLALPTTNQARPLGHHRNLAFCLLCHQMLLELWDGCSMLKSVEHWRMLSLPWFVSIYRDLPLFPSIYHCLPQFTLEYRKLNGVNKWQNLCCDNLDKRFSS